MASLKKNFVYQTLYQLLAILLPLFTAPYIARVLGADNSGIYSYSYVVANYFVVFGMLGIEQYGNRCIAKVRDNYEEMCKVFSELIICHVIISIIVSASYFVYVALFVKQYKSILLIQSLYVISVVFDVNWFFFGIEKFKVTVIRNSIIKVISFVSIFVFVKKSSDLWIYTFITASTLLISQLALIPMLRKYVSFSKVTKKGVIRHIKPMLILFIAVIAANLNRMIDKLMLGKMDEMDNLGCYDYADRIIRIPLSFIAAFGTIMLSKMSNLFAGKNSKQINRMLDISSCFVFILSFAMAAGLAAITPEFIILYLGKGYEKTNSIIMILTLSIPLVAWNNMIRTQILIPREMDKVYTIAVCVGALVNISLNIFLIKWYSVIGAAIATVISYFVISVIQTAGADCGKEIKKYLGYAIVPLLSGIFTYVMIRQVAKIFSNTITSLCAEIVTGILIYGIIIILYLKFYKPDYLALFFKREKNNK